MQPAFGKALHQPMRLRQIFELGYRIPVPFLAPDIVLIVQVSIP